jgi:hypothetical protein
MLHKHDGTFDDDEDLTSFLSEHTFAKIQSLLRAVSSTREFLDEIQTFKRMFISQVPQRIHKLVQTLVQQHILSSDQQNHPAYELKQILNTRVGPILSVVNPILLAAALDPSTVELAFLPLDTINIIQDALAFTLRKIDPKIPDEGCKAIVKQTRKELLEYSPPSGPRTFHGFWTSLKSPSMS